MKKKKKNIHHSNCSLLPLYTILDILELSFGWYIWIANSWRPELVPQHYYQVLFLVRKASDWPLFVDDKIGLLVVKLNLVNPDSGSFMDMPRDLRWIPSSQPIESDRTSRVSAVRISQPSFEDVDMFSFPHLGLGPRAARGDPGEI